MAEKKIGEISAELKSLDISEYAGFIECYRGDERPGVQKIVTKAEHAVQKLYDEMLES